MKPRILPVFILSLFIAPTYAQKKYIDPQKTKEGYKFTPMVELKATPVKNQSKTGTCWCFGTTSFIESELIRKGKGEFDLSEMWIIRHNYGDRLKDNFIQQGKGNLKEGGLAHDWMIEFVQNGIVPDEVYTGLNYSMTNHNHVELNSFINAISTVPLKRNMESDQYFTIVDAILDTYLGKVPRWIRIWQGSGHLFLTSSFFIF
jgi:Papain family cysteine protease